MNEKSLSLPSWEILLRELVAEYLGTSHKRGARTLRRLESGDQTELRTGPQAFAALVGCVNKRIWGTVRVRSEAFDRRVQNGNKERAVSECEWYA